MKKLAKQLISTERNRQISEVLDEWILALRAAHRSDKTIEGYTEQIGRFLWWLRELEHSEDMESIEPAQIRLFVQYLQTNKERWGSDNLQAKRKLSDASVQSYFRSLRAFFNFAAREQFIEASPFDDRRLPTPKIRKKIVPSFSLDDVRAMLNAAGQDSVNALRDVAIILMLLDTGMRATEACNLKLDDLEPGRIKVLAKGDKERYLPLLPETEKAIRDYKRKERAPGGEHLFLGRGLNPLTYDGFKEVIRRRAREAGVQHAHPHKFRHTFALDWLSSGGPLHALQSLLGHSSPVMSMKYAEMVSKDATDLHKQHSPVERLGNWKKRK